MEYPTKTCKYLKAFKDQEAIIFSSSGMDCQSPLKLHYLLLINTEDNEFMAWKRFYESDKRLQIPCYNVIQSEFDSYEFKFTTTFTSYLLSAYPQ